MNADYIMSQSYSSWRLDYRETHKKVVKIGEKLHKAKNSLEFLEKCSRNGLVPGFTRLNTNTVRQGRMNPQKIKKGSKFAPYGRNRE